MKYENGILILDNDETQFLSMVAMKKVDREYPATEFIGSLVEMKDEAEKYIREIKAKQDPDKNDPLRIEVTRLIIEMFDVLNRKGHEAVEATGDSIRWQ